jgi:hypothetical protein
MPDQTQNYPNAAAFHFMVRVGAPGDANETSFNEVSGMSVEMETENYQEGGENRFIHRLPKGVDVRQFSSGLAQCAKGLVSGFPDVRGRCARLDATRAPGTPSPARLNPVR